jgi:pyrimidine-specific ribonucleoside hydrolase
MSTYANLINPLRQARRRRAPGKWRTFGALLSLIALLVTTISVGAQLTLPLTAQAAGEPLKLVIDVDTGVDDAAGIVWLFSQTQYPLEVLGFTTVAGVTTVDNVTNNLLTLLDVLGQADIPVVMGAAAPLVQPLSFTGAGLHGPDGLWGVGFQNPHDLNTDPRVRHDVDVPAFYCEITQTHSNVTLLAEGPLTNLAHALDQCPQGIQSFERIIILGGAKLGGNRTPVAEFNIWQDPEAASQVLSAGLPITLITYDAFDTFTLTEKDVEKLQEKGDDAVKLVAGPLQAYLQAQILNGVSPSVPDVTAYIYTMDPSLGTAEPGLVKVVPGPRLVRGQTVIGFGQFKVPMIADDAELSNLVYQLFFDPNFGPDQFAQAIFQIMTREPDNAQVVLDIDEHEMYKSFMHTMTH